MNERLHELMMEATKDMPQCYYWPGEYVEKFAELIVRECADVAADHDALDIYEEIREHFGVGS
jgi:hypothetical protein